MANYLDKWKTDFPETVNNQTRPKNGIDNSLAFNTDGFPQRITSDPVHAKLENDMAQQLFSNDQRLKDAIDSAGIKESNHEKDSNAHANGIAGNAGSATKLATARTISLTGNAAGSATFDGSNNISISTTVNESKHAVNADSATKIVNNGNRNDIEDGVKPPSGLSVYQCYTGTGYPQQYGNVVSIGGLGDNELFLGWGEDARLLFRAKRDTQNNWMDWHAIAFTDEINNYAPTKTGGGASGTWGINISGTATKLATARNISLTGDAAGSATFDGSGDVSISTTVNKSKYAVNADVATTADNADKLTSESGSNYLTIDTDENSWSVIGSNPGNWLKSIRTETDAPPYSLGDFSAAIAFGGGDTKGIITHAFDTPNVKFAGGNGSTARWKFSIYGGFNNEVYDLNDFPTKTGGGASGTWGINISGNAARATNADKVDGYHASDLLRTLGGNRTPVITDIFDRAGTIDMSTMSAADKATHKANINKAQNVTQNIWNNDTGIHAYGGDTDINGYNHGALKLTQSYKNFDKILVFGTNDDGDEVIPRLYDVWELTYLFSHSYRFLLFNDTEAYWELYGSVRTGTDTNYSLSTDTIWNTQNQSAGIIAIYGIKY